MAAVRFPKSEVVLSQPWTDIADTSLKFVVQIDFHLLKRVLSLKPNPEVDFALYGRHCSIDR